MLDLDLIRIDGGTQARVELDQSIVAEYAEAYQAGAEFPAVTVFFDGTSRWLADGFHRFFAAKKAGKQKILENIIPGTQRDAVLFSLKANATHGLRRTNADKRKAIATLIADSEWATWSDRKIADLCGVSVPLVGAVRRPEVAEKQQQNRAASAEKKTHGCNPITPPPAAEPAPAPVKPVPKAVNVEDEHYFGPSDEELEAAQASAASDMSSLMKLIDSDDKLATLAEENKRLRAENAVIASARDGYMNRCNELITRVKTLKSQLRKAEAAHV